MSAKKIDHSKSTYYQPKTGARCHCKPGIQRDNCPECEGTGWRIDFALIRQPEETAMSACIDNYINGNLTDAKRQARRIGWRRLVQELRENLRQDRGPGMGYCRISQESRAANLESVL